MEQARYKYMELTSEDPQAFGKQLTRALNDLTRQRAEIVNISMGLEPGPNATGEGPKGMLRVAQILIREPVSDAKMPSSSATTMH